MGLCANKIFFVLLNVIKNSFFVEIKICKKFMVQNLISDNLKIATFLFFNRFVKKAKKMSFLEISRKIKNYQS
jgi:hypothetical protein